MNMKTKMTIYLKVFHVIQNYLENKMVFQSIFLYNVNKLLQLKYDSFRWFWLEVCSLVCFCFMAYLVRINKKINIVIKLNKTN